jgi:hypothetical protein
MNRKAKRFLLITSTINFIVCFLPWSTWGCVVYYYDPGVLLFPYFQDNGGLLIVFCNLFILACVFIETFRNHFSAVIKYIIPLNFLLVTYQAIRISVAYFQERNATGYTIMMPGMLLLLCSSILQIGFLLMKKLDTIESHYYENEIEKNMKY